jgi:hypothetical protein
MTVPGSRWSEPVPALVTLHLWRVPGRRVPAAVARMALDRHAVRAAPGVRFAKLLGTGRGRTFTLTDAEPRRWGLLATWADPADAARFERSVTARRWRGLAVETWRVELRPLSARGRWSGRQPFGAAGPHARAATNPSGGAATDPSGGARSTGEPPPAGRGGRMGAAGGTGPGEPVAGAAGSGGAGIGGGGRWGGAVAAVTRARLAPARARAFWRAVPPVSADLHGRPGLRLAVGIGEAPVGLQGTFSLWESARMLRAFAYDGAAHAGVVRRTAAEGWYAEELFARFAVLSATGTVDGRDPLA